MNKRAGKNSSTIKWVSLLAFFSAMVLMPLDFLIAKDDMIAGDPALSKQSLVMDMADDYIAALGEAVYLITRGARPDPRGRWLAQSFLRNGVGAALDIGAGPNPAVNLLDLLVLASLQTWSFETHWIPAGIGKAGAPALNRLRKAEGDLWHSAGKSLTKDQLRILRDLINEWTVENADRTVVALVRFKDFEDERRLSSLASRGKAKGLLKQVGEAVTAVDDARLLGERLLWYSGRYPFLLGEQTELTIYRLIDQPEVSRLFEAIKSAEQLSQSLAARIGTIQADLTQQQASFFSRLSAERKDAIAQFQKALNSTVQESLDRASESIKNQRTAAIQQLFEHISRERTLLLDDLASRQNEFLQLTSELYKTISVSGTLAKDLTETINAADRVVGRFVIDPQNKTEPLRITDFRDVAIETGRAADRMTLLLERALVLLESKSLDQNLSHLIEPVDAIADKLFWRGVLLIGILIGGLGLFRFLPQRTKDK